ncbi:hypothetical protein H6G69_18830 [Nostoc sp. FACHB-110]|nr:hypothetical protein [Nostoc sp. FACHB-110]
MKRTKASRNIIQLIYKARWQLISSATTLLIVLESRPVNAQLFNNARTAMTCMINSASSGSGISTGVLNSLPTILFTALTIVLFGYFCFSVFQGVAAYGRGEEVSNVIQQPIFTFISVILIVLFQNLLFGTGVCTT